MSLQTAAPRGALHEGVWIVLFATAQARLRPWGWAAARAVPSILGVVMPAQVALPLLQPLTAACRGCCHFVSGPCHPAPYCCYVVPLGDGQGQVIPGRALANACGMRSAAGRFFSVGLPLLAGGLIPAGPLGVAHWAAPADQLGQVGRVAAHADHLALRPGPAAHHAGWMFHGRSPPVVRTGGVATTAECQKPVQGKSLTAGSQP